LTAQQIAGARSRGPGNDGLSDIAGLAAGLAGVIIFGLTLPMTHFALEGFDIYAIGLGRAIPAALIAGAILAATRQPVPPRALWPHIFAAAAGVIFGFPLLATAAMQYVPAAHGGVILAFLPLATAMAGAIFAGERPSPAFWLAGIAGSALVLVFAMIEAGGFKLELADLLLVGAVISAGIGYAFCGTLASRLGGWQTISWALVFSLPVLIPATLLLADPVPLGASAKAWAGFFYVSLGSQFIGFFFWIKGMELAGIARTGQLQLLQPFITLAGAALLLGESVGLRHAAFAVAIIAVVFVGRQLRVERTIRA
jgi:drug/metabolite transporter (DMT)-like permease